MYHIHVQNPWWPEEGTRSLGTRWLLPTIWVLGTEPESSQRTASALNHWLQLLELLCLVSKFDTATNCSLYILAQIPGYVFRIDPGHENCISTGMDTQGWIFFFFEHWGLEQARQVFYHWAKSVFCVMLNYLFCFALKWHLTKLLQIDLEHMIVLPLPS